MGVASKARNPAKKFKGGKEYRQSKAAKGREKGGKSGRF